MPVVTSVPPRWLTPTTEAERDAGEGLDVAEFIEAFCKITKDTIAGPSGDPLVLRQWQLDLLSGLFARRADGRRKHRVALIGLPRKNGKSALGSGIGLYGLFAEGDGAEVYSCAADREQARIVFGVAKRMVELAPELAEQAKVYRDAIEVRSTGSVYRVLSSEAFTKEGLSPTLVIYDELHAAPDDELWNVMNLGSGARRDPLVLAITTAGVRTDRTGQYSICHRLYEHGRQVSTGEMADPAFFMSWWESDGAHTEEQTWREANPGFGDIVDAEDFASAVVRTPESEFRIKRCNQFVETADAWLPAGKWEALEDGAREVPDGTDVVLGFDGSYSGDSTAVVGCTLDGHLFVVGHWERPMHDPGWRVDIADVEQCIREACARWKVLEVACDPYRWQRSMQALESEGWPVVEWPTSSPVRMVPACTKLYDAVMDAGLSHDGNQALARHMANAVIKRDRFGPRIVKEAKESPRKIDLAVSAVIAFDRATAYSAEPEQKVRVAWV